MKKRTLCLILAALMLLSSLLVSCAKNEETATQGGGSQNQTTEEDTSGKFTAEVKKLNRDFLVLRKLNTTVQLSIEEIYATDINGEKVNDAVFSRNSQLQEKFGITVKEISDPTPHSTYREAMIAGEYVADVVAHTLYEVRNLANAGLLLDWASLQNIDLEKSWWNQRLTDNVTIAGKSFFITGDALTLDDRGTWVMYFNKEAVTNAGLESIYTLVDAGTWTTDKMYEYLTQCVADKNGDGIIEYGADLYGYIGEKFNNWAHVAAGNVTLSERSSDGTIIIPEQPKTELLDAWAKIKPVMTSNLRYVSSTSKHFRSGMAVFYACNLGTIVNFPNAACDFGIIPFPKLSADQQGYYTTASQSQLGCFALPTTVEADPAKDWTANGFTSAAEQVAYMMEAFAYLSVNTVTPAFYDQVLLKQSVRDVESQKNLAMVLDKDHIVLDPVLLFNFGNIGYSLFYEGTPTANANANDLAWENFVASYSSRVAAAREALKEYETITSAAV